MSGLRLAEREVAYPTPPAARWVVVAIPTVFWAGSTFIIEALSFVHSLAPADPWWWRIGLGIPALGVFGWLLWLGWHAKRVSEQTLQYSLLIVWTLSALVNLVVLLITPATFAVLIELVQTSLAAGLYFRPRILVVQTAVLGVITTTPLYLHLPGQQHHPAGAWLVLYLPVVSGLVAAMAMNRSRIQTVLEEMRTAAHTDPLTGLANRRALQLCVDERTVVSRHAGGVLLIDLDNFKAANTLHGHPGGDRALRAVAVALQRAAPQRHVVARIGGDEIAVYAPDGSPVQLAACAAMYREAVRTAGSELQLPGVELDASIGVASRPRDGDTLTELLEAADRAMYAEKVTRPRRRASQGSARAHGSPGRTRSVSGTTHVRLVPPSPTEPVDEGRTDGGRRLALLMAGILTGASLLSLVAETLPGATSDPRGVTAVCIAGLSVAAAIAAARPNPRVLAHAGADVAVAVALAILLRLSGGFTSPAVPIVFLFVLGQSMVGSPLLRRLVLPPLVLLSPLAYALPLPSESAVTTVALLCATVPISAGVALALYGTERMLEALQRRSRDEATRDPLTGLRNRRAYIDELERQVDESVARNLAVVIVDLDNFATVNNLRGHETGDDLLREIAGALRQVTRPEDFLARLGGDEFAAILHGVDAVMARALIQRYVNAVVARCARYDDPVIGAVTASAGFALHPQHGDSIDELIARADEALMAVKDGTKGRVQAFLDGRSA